MKSLYAALLASLIPLSFGSVARADLPPFAEVSKDYVAVASADQQGNKSLFHVWKRDKDSQLLGELPKNFAGKRYFIALTVSSGDRYAGLQSGEWVVEWRRYNNRLALLAPNLAIRAEGEPEAKASVKRLFTDRVLLDIPILATGPNGGPVIDLDQLLVGRDNATTFFGPSVRVTNPQLIAIKSTKVFPTNVELAFEIVGVDGRLQTLHYSFSDVPSSNNGYKPRVADARVGYFTTAYNDLSKYQDEETRVRYINRWHLEKRDPKLKLSPPKQPIRFYVEHTTPVRYRRWVKEGVEYWNKAFEKVGLIDAVVVEYQDAETGAHMEKDPEDVRYNFIRWLNNDVGTAIGPSRVHPETGEILDADIILTDGWIRHFNFNYNELMPKLAMEGMTPETLAWLGQNPNWDPRLRLAAAENVNHLRQEYAQQSMQPMAGYGMAQADSMLLGDDEFDGLYGNISQKNGLCMAASGLQLDLALARMNWELALLADQAADEQKEKEEKEKKKKEEEEQGDNQEAAEKDQEKTDKDGQAKADDEPKQEDEPAKAESAQKDKQPEKKEEESLLDGMPEWFVGPLLADLVAHEVGHTLGLRHNFKASAMLTLDEINSEAAKNKRTVAASVMDYTPINYRYDSGEIQGDYTMAGLGPYDYWAIEYGYTFDDKQLPELLKRCTEPELQYATDEDTAGPDPLARRYDLSADPLDYAKEQTKLIKLYRDRLLDRFVKDGQSWARARRGYDLTLTMQLRNTNMMAGWVGGAFVNRDKKGDPGNRPPVEVVPAQQQRDALAFIIDQTFRDEAYGLTPEIMERLSVDKWLDENYQAALAAEATWPVHDRVLGVQASALTLLMNPTTLRRVLDNEMRLAEDVDTLTLPEVFGTISQAAWTELDGAADGQYTARKPMISSLRRNLQREHIQRLLDLVLRDPTGTAAAKPIGTLARMELRTLKDRIDQTLDSSSQKLDPYSLAHLMEAQQRIEQALSAAYVLGSNQQQAGQRVIVISGEAATSPQSQP